MANEEKNRANAQANMDAEPEQESAFQPERYPLVDAGLLRDLEFQGARSPARMKHAIADVLGRHSIRTAMGEKEPEAMRQLEQAAGELIRLHPDPVPLLPDDQLLARMRDATSRAARAANRHREYEGCDELRENSHRYGPAEPSHYGVAIGLRFDKNGRTMMVNPHGTDIDYDYPEMTREGRDFLANALTDAAQTAGLELGGAVNTLLRADEKGWVTIGYNWHSQEND